MPTASAPRSSSASRPERSRPVTLVVAVALLALQAGAFVALGVAVAAAGSADGATYPVVVFAVVLGVLVALVAWSLWRRRRWARGAAVAWSLLLVLVGASQLGVNPAAAIGVILVGLGSTVCAVAPATRLALDGTDPLEADDDA